jgi:hypothetical protein
LKDVLQNTSLVLFKVLKNKERLRNWHRAEETMETWLNAIWHPERDPGREK